MTGQGGAGVHTMLTEGMVLMAICRACCAWICLGAVWLVSRLLHLQFCVLLLLSRFAVRAVSAAAVTAARWRGWGSSSRGCQHGEWQAGGRAEGGTVLQDRASSTMQQ